MLPTVHQLSECPEEQYLDVLFVQMWCGTMVFAFEFVIALPDDAAVFVCGVPYL